MVAEVGADVWARYDGGRREERVLRAEERKGWGGGRFGGMGTGGVLGREGRVAGVRRGVGAGAGEGDGDRRSEDFEERGL